MISLDALLPSNEDLCLLREETRVFIKETCSKVNVKNQLKNPHIFIIEHQREVEAIKNTQEKWKNSRASAIPYMRSIYDRTPMLPIDVSKSNLNRAYRIMDTRIKTIGEMEGYTSISTENGKYRGSFIVMSSDFDFVLKEETKREGQKKAEETPDLVLSIEGRSWFSYNKNRLPLTEYRDSLHECLEDQVGQIVYDMFVMADQLHVAAIIEEREEERKERLESIQRGELEELKLVEQAASDWEKAEKIRRFLDCFDQKTAEIPAGEKREICCLV